LASFAEAFVAEKLLRRRIFIGITRAMVGVSSSFGVQHANQIPPLLNGRVERDEKNFWAQPKHLPFVCGFTTFVRVLA